MRQTSKGGLPGDRSSEYYEALLRRDSQYDGVVYFGIRTTGIFCRSVCAARKPRPENCEYFETAQAALLAGYRPCKKCRPMESPNATSPILRKLVEAIESDPSKRWKQADFRELGIDSATARRQFQKQFGMTFVAYARARRLGIAFQEIRKGSPLTHVQLDAGFASSSGFRDAFAKIFGESPKGGDRLLLSAEWLETPLGPMLAIASREHLYLLEFVDRRGLEREVDRLRNRLQAAIVPGSNPVLRLLRRELADYFAGKSFGFTTPIEMVGTPFQKEVWEALLQIPAGESRTYADQAKSLGRSKAVRAVARANGANSLAIIIPCHRVLGSDGKLTGYAGGLARKEWLLQHETKHCQTRS